MKFSSIPTLCSLALLAMITAGLSHWWSIRQLVVAMEAVNFIPLTPKALPLSLDSPNQLNSKIEVAETKEVLTQIPKKIEDFDSDQKNFYEALIKKMQSLQNQNRDLLDQLAETNRDLMKLEFRVDTHSESFRPMPTNEERLDTSFEQQSGIGVLPPRAVPIEVPEIE